MFNREKVKVSYSYMQTIKEIINGHNMNILHQNKETKDECNCSNKRYCPLVGKSLLLNKFTREKQLQPSPTKIAMFILELQKSCSKIIQPHHILYPSRLRK